MTLILMRRKIGKSSRLLRTVMMSGVSSKRADKPEELARGRKSSDSTGRRSRPGKKPRRKQRSLRRRKRPKR